MLKRSYMWKLKGEIVEVRKRDIMFYEKTHHAKHSFSYAQMPHRQLRGEHNRQSVKQLVSLPGWYFNVYPARRPLTLSGAPHSRVRESKLGLMTLRKAGGPGTENKIRAKVNNGDVAHKPFTG